MKYDCMSIQGNGKCKHLYDSHNRRMTSVSRLFICKAMNIVLHPEMSEKGKIAEEILGISPDFDCPVMQESRLKTGEPKFSNVITRKKIEEWNV